MISITKLSITLAGVLFFASQGINAQDQQILSYKNQRGSIMKLTLQEQGDNTGTITGMFTSAVGNCQSEVGKPLAVTGFYGGNAITLAIVYPKCKKTIAMTGHFSKDQQELNTLWLVAESSIDPRGKNWNANIVGSDVYVKLAP